MSVQAFQIVLDRPNGVYFGGEVVRGKVVLQTNGDIKNRGIRIRYRGEGRVHWHIGNGDNRRDFYGSKIFEEHRYTMFGNFHCTTILDEAGENAFFGSAGGDGTMYIPCSDNEPLDIIVRVMDYDWGKKDDLLGEIHINASELAQSGQVASFPLHRNGRKETGEVTLSAKIIPAGSVFPGSVPIVSSPRKNYNSICVLRAHKATGLRKADWFGKNDVYVQAYHVPEGGVVETKAYPEPSVNTVLPAGRYEFPFSFPIRPDAPGTAELDVFRHGLLSTGRSWRLNDYAFVRHTLYANIDKALWLDPSVKIPIIVVATRPLPPPSLLSPPVGYKAPAPVSMNTCFCCPCFSGVGEISGMEAVLHRQAAASGETLPLSYKLENKTTVEVSVTVELHNHITLQTTGMLPERGAFVNTHEVFSTTVLPGDSINIEQGVLGNDRLRVPLVYPSFFGASGLATAKREPLMFSYTVRVRAQAAGAVSSAYDIEFPFVVSAGPAPAELLAQIADRDAAVVWKLIRQNTNAYEAQFAVQSTMTANPSAVADGAHSALTNGAASDNTKWTAACYLQNPPELKSLGDSVPVDDPAEEDNGAVNPAYSVYSPAAAYFPAIPPSIPSAPPAPVHDAANVIDDLGRAVANPTSTGGSSVATAQWFAAHPGVGGAITPGQLATLLGKVSFAMEQSSVGQEIARAMSREHNFTCAHVVAGVVTCSFFKAEVAVALAPFVSDPANREQVLSQLASYDREKVNAAFPL